MTFCLPRAKGVFKKLNGVKKYDLDFTGKKMQKLMSYLPTFENSVFSCN